MPRLKVSLTEEQKRSIKELVDKGIYWKDIPSLLKVKGESSEGRQMYEYMRSHCGVDTSIRNSKEMRLTDEQKEIAKEHKHLPVLDVCYKIWERKVSNLSAEARAVTDYLDSIASEISNLVEMVAYVNKYVTGKRLNKNNLNPVERRGCEALRKYLNTMTFIQAESRFSDAVEKEFLRSTFVRYTYDKPDLTEEEVDQFVLLCSSKVEEQKLLKRLSEYQRKADEAMLSEDADSEVSMRYVETVKNLQSHLDTIQKRVKELYTNLTQSRAAKMKNKQNHAITIGVLVEMWRSLEQRNRLIKIAQKREELLKEEIKRESDLDQVILMMKGISPDELLYGMF